MRGSFNPGGHPVLPLEVYGFSSKLSQKFTGMIDTGFSGFLSLPLAFALKTGLILHSTASYVLADGSTEHTLLCLGTAKAGGEKQRGLISISRGSDVLIGVDFLKKFKRKLLLDYKKNQVELG